MYEIIFKNPAKKFIKKLDFKFQKRILNKLKDLKLNSHLGKPLSGNLSGLWSLRIDKFRVIYQIQEKKLIIFILNVGHRKNIY